VGKKLKIEFENGQMMVKIGSQEITTITALLIKSNGVKADYDITHSSFFVSGTAEVGEIDLEIPDSLADALKA
jgi:hypothetical protein